jgi:hypothetical protein
MSHDGSAHAAFSIETIVWALVSMAFLLSVVWTFAILILVAKGKAGTIRDRILRDQEEHPGGHREFDRVCHSEFSMVARCWDFPRLLIRHTAMVATGYDPDDQLINC